MSQSSIVVRDGAANHELLITHRDWDLVWGPFFRAGPAFSNAFGIYDHFTVWSGFPRNSQVIHKRRGLLGASMVLLEEVKRDADLLCYDYSYSLSGDRSRYQGGRTVNARGCRGSISTRPRGYCYLELLRSLPGGAPRVAEWIDLRVLGSIELDSEQTLKVHRRRARIHWLERLPPLIEFLKGRRCAELVVEHHARIHVAGKTRGKTL